MTGRVKWFSRERNYGFLIGEDEKDYFFHGSEVQGDGKILEQDEVEFTVEETKKGLSAVNVVVKKY